MPNITAAGTYTKTSPGFENLAGSNLARSFTIAGTLGDSCAIQYKDDTSTARTIEDGTVTSLPWSKTIDYPGDLQIVVTGTPNFNVTIRS